MKIERNHGDKVKIEALEYGDAFLYDCLLHVKVDDEEYGIANKEFSNATLNLETNKPNAFANGVNVVPVKAKVTYEYI